MSLVKENIYCEVQNSLLFVGFVQKVEWYYHIVLLKFP